MQVSFGQLLTSAKQYTDVPKSHWAYPAVDDVTRLGVFQGFPDKSFRGSENLTRYQAAAMMRAYHERAAVSREDFEALRQRVEQLEMLRK